MLFIKEKSHTLTVAELPAHTHGRGTTDITGTVGGINMWDDPKAAGAFYNKKHGSNKNAAGTSSCDEYETWFQASKKWSGTSQSIGSGTAFEILPPYSVAYCFKRVL